MARADAGVGAVEMATVVARGAVAVAFCSDEVKEDGGAVTVQIPARRRRLPWRVEGEEKIRVRVLGDEDDDVAESEWSIG